MTNADSTFCLDPKDRFEIGGNDLFAAVRSTPDTGGDEGPEERAHRKSYETLADIQIRIGTLLKADTVSFLLGGGLGGLRRTSRRTLPERSRWTAGRWSWGDASMR